MWLSNSSVGRKFVMALTGACLFLFVTFHCLMNAVCIVWPSAYNVICEFLGANWYALAASAGLAVLVIIHIILACCLTLQNRAARGSVRYSIEKRPASVEWSSKNMLVLGIVILAFFVVHLIQFWAKMQYVEIAGSESVIPPTMGTLFIQEAFSCVWTPIVYIIGFIALWFHMNHGFWSMFQSCGWTNNTWIPRLKCIGNWWTSIVILCFVAQAIVFTINANNDYYKTDDTLRVQYQEMVAAEVSEENPQLGMSLMMMTPEQTYQELQGVQMPEALPTYEEFAARIKGQYGNVPEEQLKEAYEQQKNQYDAQAKQMSTLIGLKKFYGYLYGNEETNK